MLLLVWNIPIYKEHFLDFRNFLCNSSSFSPWCLGINFVEVFSIFSRLALPSYLNGSTINLISVSIYMQYHIIHITIENCKSYSTNQTKATRHYAKVFTNGKSLSVSECMHTRTHKNCGVFFLHP